MKNGPLQKWGLKTSIYRAKTRRNSGKTKRSGITTLSRLPSHTQLVKAGEFEL